MGSRILWKNNNNDRLGIDSSINDGSTEVSSTKDYHRYRKEKKSPDHKDPGSDNPWLRDLFHERHLDGLREAQIALDAGHRDGRDVLAAFECCGIETNRMHAGFHRAIDERGDSAA